jgi:hypothetical protein
MAKALPQQRPTFILPSWVNRKIGRAFSLASFSASRTLVPKSIFIEPAFVGSRLPFLDAPIDEGFHVAVGEIRFLGGEQEAGGGRDGQQC